MESNVRRLRKRLGLSQKELGEKIGVSQQVVSRIEREREAISVDVLLQLASFFKVSTDHILKVGEPEMVVDGWMRAITAGRVRKDDILALVEETDNLRSREWQYVWFLINVLRDY